jgi:hypothetical protein
MHVPVAIRVAGSSMHDCQVGTAEFGAQIEMVDCSGNLLRSCRRRMRCWVMLALNVASMWRTSGDVEITPSQQHYTGVLRPNPVDGCKHR